MQLVIGFQGRMRKTPQRARRDETSEISESTARVRGELGLNVRDTV